LEGSAFFFSGLAPPPPSRGTDSFAIAFCVFYASTIKYTLWLSSVFFLVNNQPVRHTIPSPQNRNDLILVWDDQSPCAVFDAWKTPCRSTFPLEMGVFVPETLTASFASVPLSRVNTLRVSVSSFTLRWPPSSAAVLIIAGCTFVCRTWGNCKLSRAGPFFRYGQTVLLTMDCPRPFVSRLSNFFLGRKPSA